MGQWAIPGSTALAGSANIALEEKRITVRIFKARVGMWMADLQST